MKKSSCGVLEAQLPQRTYFVRLRRFASAALRPPAKRTMAVVLGRGHLELFDQPLISFHFLLFFCLLASGCAGSSPRPEIDNNRPERAYLIPSVPFFPQKELLCGPASLQSVFAFLGTDVPQEEIARDIFIPKIKGTLHFDLVLYARKKGFTTLTPEGSLDEMIRQIRSNRPVIAFLNQGTSLFPLGHYIVIIGYDQRNEFLIAHSGTDEFEQIKYSKFLSQWETTGRWMLVILPR